MGLPANTNVISNWSFSKLTSFESCRFRVKLKYIDRMPELPRPPENPLERGNRIHDRMEKAIKGEGPLDTEARAAEDFHPMVEHLQLLYKAGMATAEQDWTFNRNWDECGKWGYWLWAKLDYSVIDEANATVITGDWKTGKSQYKVVTHVDQTQLYAAISALKYPWADTHITEIAYLDEGHIHTEVYNRDEALRFVGRFEKRVEVMENERIFKPNPSRLNCSYCPYGKRPGVGTGACPYAA